VVSGVLVGSIPLFLLQTPAFQPGRCGRHPLWDRLPSRRRWLDSRSAGSISVSLRKSPGSLKLWSAAMLGLGVFNGVGRHARGEAAVVSGVCGRRSSAVGNFGSPANLLQRRADEVLARLKLTMVRADVFRTRRGRESRRPSGYGMDSPTEGGKPLPALGIGHSNRGVVRSYHSESEQSSYLGIVLIVQCGAGAAGSKSPRIS